MTSSESISPMQIPAPLSEQTVPFSEPRMAVQVGHHKQVHYPASFWVFILRMQIQARWLERMARFSEPRMAAQIGLHKTAVLPARSWRLILPMPTPEASLGISAPFFIPLTAGKHGQANQVAPRINSPVSHLAGPPES